MNHVHVTYGPGVSVDASEVNEMLECGVEDGLISIEQKENMPDAAIGILMVHSDWIQQFKANEGFKANRSPRD